MSSSRVDAQLRRLFDADDAGFADILGRKYGAHKLPYNNSKSFVGSVAFFVIASLASMGYVTNPEFSFECPNVFIENEEHLIRSV